LFNISDELAKPPVERNMLPLVEVCCPVCVIKDCSLPDCPISLAKWDGIIPGAVPAVKTEEVIERPKTIKAILQPNAKLHQQLNLFN
jgi:hypothetical protein